MHRLQQQQTKQSDYHKDLCCFRSSGSILRPFVAVFKLNPVQIDSDLIGILQDVFLYGIGLADRGELSSRRGTTSKTHA